MTKTFRVLTRRTTDCIYYVEAEDANQAGLKIMNMQPDHEEDTNETTMSVEEIEA